MKNFLFVLAILGSASTFAQTVKDGKVATDSKNLMVVNQDGSFREIIHFYFLKVHSVIGLREV